MERTKPRVTGLQRAGISVGEKGEDRRERQQARNREKAGHGQAKLRTNLAPTGAQTALQREP